MAYKFLWDNFYQSLVNCDRTFTRTVSLPRPVISIGNIALGGRAKTPLTIEVVKILQELNFKPVVLTRGYKRTHKDSVTIENMNPDSIADSAICGDEPLEIYIKTKCSVLVGKNRHENARNYSDTEKTVFVLDDGAQHWKIKKQLNIVSINETDKSDHIFPFGRLREKPSALSRADSVISLGQDFIKKTIIKHAPQGVKSIIALTTRAQGQEKYFEEISQQCSCDVETIELPDHLESRKMIAYLGKSRVKHVVLGFKEIVKLNLTFQELSSIFEIGFFHYKKNNADFFVYYADCELKFFEDQLLKKIILENGKLL